MNTNEEMDASAERLTRHRILIVDDEAMNRALLEAILLSQGKYQLAFASLAEEAYRLARNHEVDLILLDTTLPGVDGYTACRQLKLNRLTERVPIILLADHANSADRSKGLQAGAEDVLGKPFHRTELILRVSSLLRIKSLHDQLDEVENVILALSRVMEARDQYTQAHTERVAGYAVALGEEIGLSEEDRRLLYRAALLHDIGKVGISELILNKPGALTPEETRIVREQSVLSAEICAPMRSTPQILPIIRHIHEHIDGSGYPDHLVGDQIPLGARILGIADAYDAMTSQRPYRPALTPAKARALLSGGAGQQWDKKLVDRFLAVLNKQAEYSRPAMVA
ncbi:MAG: response regulator [Capsulimonadaceae bacterium]|nr:response regulator [Capsulimonadaceae bacterium]